ncbi:MAG: cell division protein ZapA [Spirochaetes bacterium]|nr:cell division protein ZapA [Spirochaetota bacterium]
MNQLIIEILGNRFTIQSQDDKEHLESVAEYLRAQIEEVKSNYPTADPVKLMILTSLNIADNLLKLQKSGSGDEVQQITERLIFELDQNLFDN